MAYDKPPEDIGAFDVSTISGNESVGAFVYWKGGEFNKDNALFLNSGDGRFRDVSHSAWVADYRGAMGLGLGDWDNRGRLDIFITHWLAQENALYVDETPRLKVTPEAPLRFVDQADILGLGQIALGVIGWGTGFLDYDNDGRLDLYCINGSTFQQDSDATRLVPMRSFLFWNAGEQGYYEVGQKAGPPFATLSVGRGASFADYDGDGDLDIAYVVHGGGLRLARNEGGNRNGWVRVVLRAPRNTHARHHTYYSAGALPGVYALQQAHWHFAEDRGRRRTRTPAHHRQGGD